MPRILAIGLDGFEIRYAEQLLDEGALPGLDTLLQRSARVRLDHGAAQRTGLGWEHFWSGMTPEAAHRPTAVEFDPSRYAVWQEGARFAPFFAGLDTNPVVLDAPYADFDRAPDVRGVVAWGAHDPGLTGGPVGRPTGLVDELIDVAGPYPATPWTYAYPWDSPEDCAAMGRELAAGVDTRARAATWLIGERFTDWELALVVVSELHSGNEGLWHGVDPDHPLHGHASAGAAGDALRGVYTATDRLVTQLVDAGDPATVVVFAMGGMGANQADVPSMMLLPEVLHRWTGLGPRLVVPDEWSRAPQQVPALDGGPIRWQPDWCAPRGRAASARSLPRRIGRHLPAGMRRRVRRVRPVHSDAPSPMPVGYLPLGWQPASWYRSSWARMRAFALPSFYDGRIRVNLEGREAQGVVPQAEYASVCAELEEVLFECTDPRTGEAAVAAVERAEDPMTVGSSGADLVIVWGPSVNGITHPRLGLIGPVPHRRPGGHTGPYGYAATAGPGIVPGDHGFASSFDVAPTILDLLGRDRPVHVSGTSLLGRLTAPPDSAAV